MLNVSPREISRVLCVGAHSDDIEIGCGGTLLHLMAARPGIEVCWAVLSGSPAREQEARSSAQCILAGCKGTRLEFPAFRESYFPEQWTEIKSWFEEVRKGFEPDLVFAHYRNDRHQDHRVISDLAWNTFRNHFVLEYEIPKYDGDLGAPNVFVPIGEAQCEAKVNGLMRFFPTQASKHWFAPELFKGLMRIRGMECASPTGYAEAFYGRKMTVGF